MISLEILNLIVKIQPKFLHLLIALKQACSGLF